jgi:hypothetical protein
VGSLVLQALNALQETATMDIAVLLERFVVALILTAGLEEDASQADIIA